MEENLEPQQTADFNRIVPVNIEEQMKTAYIDYSMSVIVGRALPDVRDGLKPVHRRILHAMNELGMYYNRPYKKSARIVGEVLGKYHPHGDTAVYDAMVRMAQEWSIRYNLIDGQGNFGSQDGDGPAAMRYTEARLHRIAESMLMDIEKDTVDFGFNFDDSLKEPTVLPTRIPNLLVNGSSGIAVGMATNMMPHNLSEVIDGCTAYIDNREITIDELMQYVKAPDFPTGGIIFGMEGVKAGFHFGRGRVVLRGKLHIDAKPSGREQIIITEVPYQVNRDALCDRIGQLVNEKAIEGIAHVNNESNNKEGIDPSLVVRGNRIKVDRHSKVLNTANIYALGDLATMETTKYPNGHPQVASVAIQQADVLAENLKRMERKSTELFEYEYHDKGSMATFGRNAAAVDLPKPKLHFSGFFAWLIWMILHLFLILGVKNRIVIFINWVYSYITYDQSLRLIFKEFYRPKLPVDEGKQERLDSPKPEETTPQELKAPAMEAGAWKM